MSTLPITIIQAVLHWQDKPANLKMFEEKINGIKERTAIVVLPEMFSTGFAMQPQQLAETMDGETVQWMKRLAAERKVIIAGSVIIKEGGEDAAGKASAAGVAPVADTGSNVPFPVRYYNRLIWMLPNGQYGFYDKRHRFAFAGEHENYTAGTKRLIASVNGWKINLLVCYDLRFPVWSRQSAPLQAERGSRDEAEYDVLIYVANWPEKRSAAWKTLLQARAIENQCYVVGVNRLGDDGNAIHYSGDSMVIDPLGEILYHSKDEPAVSTVSLDKTHLQTVREKFPFWKDADEFTIL